MLCHSARQTHLCRATCEQPAARGPGSLRPAQRRSSSLAGRGEEQRPQPAPGRRGTPQLRGSASRDLLVPAAERNRARPRRLRPCGGGRGGSGPTAAPPFLAGGCPGPCSNASGVGNRPEREGELARPRPRVPARGASARPPGPAPPSRGSGPAPAGRFPRSLSFGGVLSPSRAPRGGTVPKAPCLTLRGKGAGWGQARKGGSQRLS